jgi:aspartate aminotransferase-like enzyme
MLRKLFQTSANGSQPFVLSGSGTLGWDLVAANLVEAGEDVLVLSSGYFSDGFADCLEVYGAKVSKLGAPVGSRPQLPEIEKALKEKKYKVLTVTHVDTSTGVLSELKDLSALVQKISPDTLLVVDGVCSVASEEIAFDDWNIDGVVTASQKAIGVPAGLSISMFSKKAMQAFENRKTPPASYFASMKNWTPSMCIWCTGLESSLLTPCSNAKLRGKEAILLCNAISATDSRTAYRVDPNLDKATGREVPEAQGGFRPDQGSRQGPWAEASGFRTRKPGARDDCNLLA